MTLIVNPNLFKNHVVVTTDYATNRIVAVYGPMTEVDAKNSRMSLPASSTRDHDAIKLSPIPITEGK